jgi:Tol biopolymer transport system component
VPDLALALTGPSLATMRPLSLGKCAKTRSEKRFGPLTSQLHTDSGIIQLRKRREIIGFMGFRRFLWVAAIPLIVVGSWQNALEQTTSSASNEKIRALVYDVQDALGMELSFYGAVHGSNTASSDIYIQNDPKKESRRLVRGAQDPAWSYDGQKLAFLGFRRVIIDQLSTAPPPPSDISCYEPGHSCNYQPANGRSISASSLAARQINVMSANGSVKQITNVPSGVWDFGWSPVEEKIAYCEAGPKDRDAIVMLSADGSGRTELTKMGEVRCAVGMPVIEHPIEALEGIDFTRILAGKAIIRVVSGHGSSAVSDAVGEIVGVPTINWSPDGKTIAFTGVLGGKPVVGLVSTDGSGKPKPLVNGYAARWSPDGKELLFLHDSETSPAVTSICIVNADGTHPRKVLDNEAAEFGLTWTPDGKSIGFASTRDNKNQSEIFRIHTDGTGLQKIASQEKLSLISPLFSPDGSELLFYARTFGSVSDFSIWVMDLASHQQERLANGSHPSVLWLK